MPYRLGVDLGTTWTAGATHSAAEVEAVEAGEHGPALPSVVARDGDAVVVGEAAERRLMTDPAGGVREPKRRLGDETPFVLGGAPYGAEALLGHLLAHVVARATEQRGEPPAGVVLTHPATWGDYKLDLLREAARVAGVPEDGLSLLSEPQAAALHYSTLGRMDVGDAVAVYDFGGGTFDAAVVRRTEDRFELVGQPQGLERLGGVDLDQAVFAHVQASVGGQMRELDTADVEVRHGLLRLRAECVAAKEALSVDSEAAVAVALPGLSTHVRITREEFEAMVRPRLAQTVEALRTAVAKAGIEMEAIRAVLLIGGTSRIPLVGEIVSRETGRPAAVDVDPKLAVAMGAAAYGTVPEAAVADDASDGNVVVAADGRRGEEPAGAERRSSRLTGRAARIAAGGVVGAGVIAGGAAAAGALGGEADDRPPDGEPVPPADAPPGEPDPEASAPPAAAPAEYDPELSLDAFDDVGISRPAGRGGGGAGGGGGGAGGSGRAAPPRRSPDERDDDDGRAMGTRRGGTQAPKDEEAGGDGRPAGERPPVERPAAERPPDGPPGGGGTDRPPPPNPQVDAFREQMLGALKEWQPPPEADAADVAALREELTGAIEGFQPRPGLSLEESSKRFSSALNDRVKGFEAKEQREEAEQKSRQLEQDREKFEGYTDALQRYVDQLDVRPWHFLDPELSKKEAEEIDRFKANLKEQLESRPYVPEKDQTMRQVQERLKEGIDRQMTEWRDGWVNKLHSAEVGRIYRERGPEEGANALKLVDSMRDDKLNRPLVPTEAASAVDGALAPPDYGQTPLPPKADGPFPETGVSATPPNPGPGGPQPVADGTAPPAGERGQPAASGPDAATPARPAPVAATPPAEATVPAAPGSQPAPAPAAQPAMDARRLTADEPVAATPSLIADAWDEPMAPTSAPATAAPAAAAPNAATAAAVAPPGVDDDILGAERVVAQAASSSAPAPAGGVASSGTAAPAPAVDAPTEAVPAPSAYAEVESQPPQPVEGDLDGGAPSRTHDDDGPDDEPSGPSALDDDPLGVG